MRILLDECLPAELADELTGHEVRTVQQEGWAGFENGELLAVAAASFSALLTVDKRLQYQQRIPPTLMVVTIRARANRIDVLRPLVPAVLDVQASGTGNIHRGGCLTAVTLTPGGDEDQRVTHPAKATTGRHTSGM